MKDTTNKKPTPVPEDATPVPEDAAPAPPEPTPPEAEAPEAEAQDPNVIGKVTPEEQAALMTIRNEQQQRLLKLGEHDVVKSRLVAELKELEQKGQVYINEIAKRLGIQDGQQWVALGDGTIRLVPAPDVGQTQTEGGAGAPSG